VVQEQQQQYFRQEQKKQQRQPPLQHYELPYTIYHKNKSSKVPSSLSKEPQSHEAASPPSTLSSYNADIDNDTYNDDEEDDDSFTLLTTSTMDSYTKHHHHHPYYIVSKEPSFRQEPHMKYYNPDASVDDDTITVTTNETGGWLIDDADRRDDVVEDYDESYSHYGGERIAWA
jgi:hypothetical protein